MKKCPYCHAELQDEASFCIYCMHSLIEKENIEVPKNCASKRIKIIICAVLAAVIAVSTVTFVYLNNRKICNYDFFKLALEVVSEEFECDKLWNTANLKDYYVDDNWTFYSLPVYDNSMDVWISFYNGGEEIFVRMDNITDKTMHNARKMAICIIDSIYKSYLLEAEDFLGDEYENYYPYEKGNITYPDHVKIPLNFSYKFDSEKYKDAEVSSKFQIIEVQGINIETLHQLYTVQYEDSVSYDMMFYFYKPGSFTPVVY